ncbi:MAG: translation elongation factor Ts [Candidatus Peregrinibacteria bacterium]|nr:translation elongation factor Ts [Candidatus Peregrinibacteria bacterium]
MAITAAQVNELRKRTGISMMQCKKALEEAGGDEEKAIELLRKKGAAKAAEKSDRDTSEGIVVTKVEGDKAVIVLLSCETDFVSKNEEFVAIAENAASTALASGVDAAKQEAEPAIKELFAKLGENMGIEVDVVEGEGIGEYVHTNGKVGAIVQLSSDDAEKARDVAMHITAMNPAVVHPDDLPEDLVIKERDIWAEQLKNEGKPAEIVEKIMMGKEKKFREESALIKQSFVKDGEKTVEQYLEGNNVTSFVRKSI